MEKNLDLAKFKFPTVSGAEGVFPTFDTIKELLEEATLRGYDNGNMEGCRLFSQWFFNGIEAIVVKDMDNAQEAFTYMRAFMGSWSPKHEHKEAVCGMLIDEFMTITLKKKDNG